MFHREITTTHQR